MIKKIFQPGLIGNRIPRSFISYAIWAFHRSALSHRDLIDLFAVRSVCTIYETIRRCVGKFGVQTVRQARAARQRPSAKWRLDEAVIKIRGVKHWPRRKLTPDADHRAHKNLNNRIEGSHRPTRKH
jgi:putative transposase